MIKQYLFCKDKFNVGWKLLQLISPHVRRGTVTFARQTWCGSIILSGLIARCAMCIPITARSIYQTRYITWIYITNLSHDSTCGTHSTWYYNAYCTIHLQYTMNLIVVRGIMDVYAHYCRTVITDKYVVCWIHREKSLKNLCIKKRKYILHEFILCA